MKFFIPFKIQDIGGTSTFARKFQHSMQALGYEVVFEEPENYDILFLIVQAPFDVLWRAKKRKVPIVQRLDGVYYWSIAGWKYPLYNLKAQIIRHFFADFTIYQSQYSKYCAEKFLGKKNIDPSAIIYNGVDIEIFSPEGEKLNLRDNPEQQIFFTASAFRRPDQIIPIIEALKIYKDRYSSNFKLFVAGTFSTKVAYIPQKYKDFTNIKFIGKIKNADLPDYERSSDVFLFTHLNPPCPNNVIEAMACGLPICGIADGAMQELTREHKNALLIPVSDNAFWRKRNYNIEAFARNIQNILDNREKFSRESIEITQKKFSLESMVKKYELVIRDLDGKLIP